MRNSVFLCALLVAAVAAAHDNGLSFSTKGDLADCSGVTARFNGRPLSVVTQEVPAAGLRSLTLRSNQHGAMQIVRAEGDAFSITACKASARDASASDVHVTLNGDELTVGGPAQGEDWMTYLIVRAPRGAAVDGEAHSGPVSVRGFDGDLTLRALDGPLTLNDAHGTIRATVDNGPLTVSGGSGTVKLIAKNGPLTVKLTGGSWSGSLDASAVNGPLSLSLPRGYRSGVVVDTGSGPVSCRAEGCGESHGRQIELGSGPAAVHISTANGPVSIRNREE